MDQPINVEYQWTYDEFLTAIKFLRRRRFHPVIRILFYYLLATVLAAPLIFLYEKRWDLLSFSTFTIMALAISLWWKKRWLRRQFLAQAEKCRLQRWSISPEQISISGELSHSEASWQAVLEVTQTPKGYLLFYIPQVAHWLPRHAFPNEAMFEEFAALAREKAKKFSTIK